MRRRSFSTSQTLTLTTGRPNLPLVSYSPNSEQPECPYDASRRASIARRLFDLAGGGIDEGLERELAHCSKDCLKIGFNKGGSPNFCIVRCQLGLRPEGNPTDNLGSECRQAWKGSDSLSPLAYDPLNGQRSSSFTHDLMLVERELSSVAPETLTRPDGDCVSTDMLNTRPLSLEDAERVDQLVKNCGGCLNVTCALYKSIAKLKSRRESE